MKYKLDGGTIKLKFVTTYQNGNDTVGAVGISESGIVYEYHPERDDCPEGWYPVCMNTLVEVKE